MFDFLSPYKFAIQIGSIVLVGIILMAGYLRLIAFHEDIGFQRAKAACSADKLIAEQAQNQREEEYRIQLRKANHDAEQRQVALSSDIDNLNRQLERMRIDRKAMRSRVAELSDTTARSVADACLEVHGECTERYGALAKETGRIVSDCQTLIESWPQ